MQTDNRLLDDLTKIATGALGTLQGAKHEVEGVVRQRLEVLLAGMDLVTREEFEAVKAMAAAAREENERLAARIAALEAAATPKRKPATRKKAEPKD
jgi:BMFP domain-containing protein YqiC